MKPFTSPGLVVTTGGSLSTTLTFAVHEEVCPSVSLQVSVTGVVPSGYGPGGFWVQPARSLSASLEPALMDALAWQEPSAGTVTSWHLTAGAQPGWAGGTERPKKLPRPHFPFVGAEQTSLIEPTVGHWLSFVQETFPTFWNGRRPTMALSNPDALAASR